MEGPGGFGLLFAAVAALLVAAKAGGVLAERWGQPPVLGELLVGIALGNLLLPLLGTPEAQAVSRDPAVSEYSAETVPGTRAGMRHGRIGL